MSDQSVRIVIAGGGTGGHVQPAIATSDVLRERANVDLTWIGSATGVEKDSALERNIPFRSIPTGKLRRYFSLHTFIDAIRIPAGILRARLHLRDLKPDVIFSTGGFVSVPTVVAGWLAGIPIVTHEQTATVGLANKINARLADRIALAYQDTGSIIPFAKDRIVITGNPVRSSLLDGDGNLARKDLGLPKGLPVIYITGGSLGAQAINGGVQSIIPDLVQHACVIHQCGPAAMNGDFPRLLDVKASLPEDVKNRYVVSERIGPELNNVYALADLVIGRSGGGTVAELALLGKPSILIPLPGTASDEQTQNARILEKVGGALLIPQSELDEQRLLNQAIELIHDHARLEKMGLAAKSAAQPDAANLLAGEILDLARKPGQ